ncbi:MAG: hypothetical protein OEY38_00135 [Gammaproteobacteria bacterium]|nr:hypothetical protein [Gammaproteobacteria bacterium]
MMNPSEELRKLLSDATGVDTSTLTHSDIQKLGINSVVIQGVHNCLSSDDQADISTGFLFLNALLEKNKPGTFGTDFFKYLVGRLEKLLKHESKYVCYQALELFVWLKDNYPNYREIMADYLISDDLGYRRIALYHYYTYAKKGEISPLIHFRQDDYAAEKGMNSDYFYELRDLALEKISSLAGKQFCSTRISEPYDGTVVSWYDWSLFLEWWELEKSNYL